VPERPRADQVERADHEQQRARDPRDAGGDSADAPLSDARDGQGRRELLEPLLKEVAVAKVRREGVVPVRTSALPFQLDCAGSLIVEDTAYGKELEAMLQPAKPRIRVAIERGIA